MATSAGERNAAEDHSGQHGELELDSDKR